MYNIFKLRVSLPIRSLGSTNVYAIKFDSATWLIDSGMFDAFSFKSFLRGLREKSILLEEIEKVFITHFHVDHSTLVLLLVEFANPDLYIAAKDYEVVLDKGVEEYIESSIKLFRENGAPEEDIIQIKKTHPALRLIDAYNELMELPWKKLSNGNSFREDNFLIHVIEVPGHTPGHVILNIDRENALFLGDTVLPKITPHVTLHFRETNPLGDYINSLKKIAKLGSTVGYPGHGSRIENVESRIREILSHHRERFNDIIRYLIRVKKASGYQIAKAIRWRVKYKDWSEYPGPEKFFALGEALAHLRFLEELRVVEQTYNNSIVNWRLSMEPEEANRLIKEKLST